MKMDRVSNLSDDLLLKILSSLGTKDVLKTMFLSKRWKLLWTMVPRLYFEDGYIADDTYDEDEYSRFRQFVDTFLESHRAPVLDTLSFDIGCLSKPEELETWIQAAIARDFRQLEIHRFRLDDDDDAAAADVGSLTLPNCVYTYGRLVVLKLYKTVYLDVPLDLEVSLSSLKTLHLLGVEYASPKSQRRLLAGCPVLEELVVDNFGPDYVEHEPTSHNLKSHINVPSLIYLNYVDIFDYGHLCRSKNMPHLVQANVKLVCKHPKNLLTSLTSVKRLSLCLHGSMLRQCIRFSHLVYLELCGCAPKWWDLLTWMLQSSPKLQVFKLNKCEETYFGSIEPIKRGWRQPTSVPECLRLHLHTFEWECYNGRKEEKKLADYILKNARHLKRATFSNQEIAWEGNESS